MYLKDLLTHYARLEKALMAQRTNMAFDVINAIAPRIDPKLLGLPMADFTAAQSLGLLNNSIVDALNKNVSFAFPAKLDNAISAMLNHELRESFSLQASFAFGSYEAFNEFARLTEIPVPLVDLADSLTASYTSFLTGLADQNVGFNAALALSRFATSTVDLQYGLLAGISEATIPRELLTTKDLRPNTLDVLFEDVVSGKFSDQTLSIDEADRVLEKSHSFRLQDLAIEMATLRYEINTDAEAATGDPVFKATTRTEFYASQFGVTVTVNRQSFDAFVRALYEYLYESSGKWARINDFIPFPKVAERIKHFRLHAAHDTQHGSSSDIRKKALQRGGHFKDLIGHRVPQDQTDWQLAQLRLLEEILLFLNELSQAVKESCR